jgi:hypothetical protein
MITKHYLAAECNRRDSDMSNVIIRLDGANGRVVDSLESQRRYCSGTGFATPCGYAV